MTVARFPWPVVSTNGFRQYRTVLISDPYNNHHQGVQDLNLLWDAILSQWHMILLHSQKILYSGDFKCFAIVRFIEGDHGSINRLYHYNRLRGGIHTSVMRIMEKRIIPISQTMFTNFMEYNIEKCWISLTNFIFHIFREFFPS